MAVVAVLRTSPEHVVEDYGQLMELAGYRDALPNKRTILKLNLSWTLFFPSCSSPPWQVDGVLSALRGYDVVAVENQTVVTHPWKGAYNNRWLPVLKEHGVPFLPLTDVEWVRYEPKGEMLAMYEVFEEQPILVPKMFIGSNMVHLPTMKTHGHTITTGAMKNAFGGLIPKYRHHAHRMIHEVLVDLLTIQHEIHEGLFAVMDGCVCGDGAGPRTMRPRIENLVLASSDMVAIDALAAHIMGFEPLDIPYIRLAHEMGLGVGDVDEIEVAGMDEREVKRMRLGFKTKKSPIIMWDQILRRSTARIGWLHRLLFHSPLFRTFILASELYHDGLWYPTVGKRIIGEFMKTEWGRALAQYEMGEPPEYTDVVEWDPY